MIAAAPDATWRHRAACAGEDTNLWFPSQPIGSQAMTICRCCPVRAECLHDALAHETPGSPRYGIRGGLTTGERQRLQTTGDPQAMTIAALRRLLDEAGNAPDDERTPTPVTTAPTRPAPPAIDVKPKTTTAVRPTPPTEPAELVTISKLLAWAEEHPDPDVQDQGARAEAALTGLRQRYTADKELAAIAAERQELEKRLAAIQAREAELAPAKKKAGRRASPSYDAKAVRAWAAENSVDCPPVGRVPKRVLDAWRAATTPA